MEKQSKLMERVPASATMSMAETARRLEAQGVDVVHFEIGEPDFTTPDNIIKAAYEAMKKGGTHYTSSRGIPQLCEAIGIHEAKFGITADPRKNIVITPGSKFAVYSLLMATVDPGDKVAVICPAWPSYADMVTIIGATPVYVKTNQSFHIDQDALDKSISTKTKLIMVNSPNNPTGSVLDKSDLNVIRDCAVDKNLIVMSDEIYKMMVYNGAEHVSLATLPDMADRTVVIDGFSKTYAMTGWRLGYAVGDEKIIGNIIKIQQNTTTCATSFSQYAAVEALNGPQDFVQGMLDEYAIRRKTSLNLLSKIKGVKCSDPNGAFYVFPDVSGFGKSDREISQDLLQKGVTLTPGSPFGLGGEGHLRISYATNLSSIIEGMGKLKQYFDSL